MNGMRILGSVVATILVSSLGTLVACSAPSQDKQETIPTSQAVSAASVQVDILDASGSKIGSASGVMIAPQLVLTAAHNLAGQASWKVTSADGKQISTSARAMTYDWMNYESDKAHPRRHDVGVIHLDTAIKLEAYPQLVTSTASDNVSATRVRGVSGTFVQAPVTLNKVLSSPNNWIASRVAGETLETGGAVYNDKGILGIVSGQGMTTGKLYIARVDSLGSWLDAKVACAGGSEGVRNYVAPVVDKSVSDCDAGGASSGTISTSGGPSSGSTSPNGTSGSGSDNGGTCSGNTDGHCSGNGCGTGGTNGANPTGDDDDDTGSTGGSSGSGSNSGSGAGSSGSSGTNGASPSGGSNGGSNGSAAGSSGSGSNSGSGAGSSGSSGTNGASPSGGSNGGSNGSAAGSSGTGGDTGSGAGSSGSSGSNPNNGTANNGGANGNVSGSGNNGGTNGNGSGASGGSTGGAGSSPNGGNNGEACQGASDNADICPPEPTDCSGPTCGGGTPDDAIDYGNCACGSKGGSTIIVR